MPIVGYDQLPSGLLRFRKDDGTSMSFQGPEADRLRAWVDQTQGPNMQLASNEPPPYDPNAEVLARNAAQTKEDLAAHQTRTDATAAEAALTPQQRTKASWDAIGQYDAKGNKIGPPIVAEPAPMGPPPPPVAAPPPAQSARVASSPPVPPGAPPGARPEPPSSGRVEPPDKTEPPPMAMGGAAPAGGQDGKAAVGDAVSQLALATAMERPSGGHVSPAKLGIASRTVEGSGPADQAANARILDADRAGQEASLAEYRAAAEQKKAYFASEEENAANAAIESHRGLLDAQNHATAVQQAWDKTYSGLQREQDAVANQKIDPKRIFSGDGGTFRAIMSTIGVALGTFGSGMSGGPNYALQIVNSSIDRDIAAQQENLRRRGQQADNAVANFVRAYGMQPEEAKLAVRSIAQQYAGQLAQVQAARLGTVQSQEEAAKIAAQLQNDALKTMAEAQSKLQARVSETYKMQGGAGGGDTPEKRLARLKVAEEIQALEDKHSGSGKPGKLSARLGSQEATNESAIEDLDNFIRTREGKGFVLPDSAVLPRTDARIDTDAVANAIAGKVVVGSNGSISQEELSEIKHDLKSSREVVAIAAAKRLKEALGTAHTAIERQRGGVDQGVGAEQEAP